MLRTVGASEASLQSTCTGPMLQRWRLRPGVRPHRESTAELGRFQSWAPPAPNTLKPLFRKPSSQQLRSWENIPGRWASATHVPPCSGLLRSPLDLCGRGLRDVTPRCAPRAPISCLASKADQETKAGDWLKGL